MNIFMWSGPRNISTALMRSFENRDDTQVIDEPFYAYYLHKTKKNHPMKNEIIKKYLINEEKIINLIMKKPEKDKKIYYQKHMTHHILDITQIDWIYNGVNCFLIRDPLEVINSYSKKNSLETSYDIGYPSLLKIFNKLKLSNKETVVINSKDLLNSPKKVLKKLCNKINIDFDNKMINWPKGARSTDGIWSSVWYESVKKSSNFGKYVKNTEPLPSKFKYIYDECLEIYNLINKYKI